MMDPTQLIVELAKQIEAQQAAHQFWYWTSVAAVSFLFGAAGSFVSEYFKKRGETKAIQADLFAIKTQQSSIAEAVARVQAEVGHADWKKRELISLRREKLELLLVAAGQCAAWAFDHVQELLGRVPRSSKEDPLAVVHSYALGYFPALVLETLRLSVCQVEMLQVARREQLRRLIAAGPAAATGHLPAVDPVAEKCLTMMHALLLAQADMVVFVGSGIMRDLLGADPVPLLDPTVIRDGAVADLRKFFAENGLVEPTMMTVFRDEIAVAAKTARGLR